MKELLYNKTTEEPTKEQNLFLFFLNRVVLLSFKIIISPHNIRFERASRQVETIRTIRTKGRYIIMAAERDSLTQDYLDTVRVDDPLEPAPPEGVFQALKNAGGNDDDDIEDDDDDDRDERIRQRARDLLDGGGGDAGNDDEELAHTGVDGTPDDALTPRFSKSGKFVGYESRIPIEDRGVADIMFNGSPQDVKDAFRRNKRCRGLLYGTSIFLFALAIGLTFFMVGDLIGMAIEKDLPGQSLAGADSAVAEGEKKHTHPKMNHTKPPSASSPSHSSPAADPTSIIPAQSPASTPSQASPYDPMASQYAQETSYPPTGGGTPMEEISRVVKVEPAALATIKRAEPDDRFDGIEELGVENNERVSFVRFDLSQHPGTNASHYVVYATLLLYLKSHDDVDEGGTTLLVELLPNAGAWVEDTVSWNDPPDATGAVAVATHRWAGESFEELHPIELNVKAAIMNVAVNATGEATFRLSTESGGFLFFEGRKWNSGVGVPELAISYN